MASDQQSQKDKAATGRRYWPQFQLPTAASLQRRFYAYLLSKLTLLTNADLDNAEHLDGDSTNGSSGGGGFGHVVLRNVELDSDKLSSYLAASGAVPGAYVRYGGLARLELELLATGVSTGGGTRVVGDGVKVTVALTRAAYNAASDNDGTGLESLLERTTADLAESIIMPAATGGPPGAFSPPSSSLLPESPDSNLTDSESSTTSSNTQKDSMGYGLGDFSGVVNRVVDAAISRLDVILRDVRVRVLIAGTSNKLPQNHNNKRRSQNSSDGEDVELELVVHEIRFCTTPDDGTRRVAVRGIECIVKSNTVGSTSSSNNGSDKDIINNFDDASHLFGSSGKVDASTVSTEDHSVIASRMFQSALPNAYFQDPGRSFYQSIHSDDEPDLNADNGLSNSIFHGGHGSDDSTHEGFRSMMDSMVITPQSDSDDAADNGQSTDAATKSIYMSAMIASQSVDLATPTSQHPRLFWLDRAELSFRGLDLSALVVSVGNARVGVAAWPEVVVATLDLLESHLLKQATVSTAPAFSAASKNCQKEKNKTANSPNNAEDDQAKEARLEKFSLDQLEVSFTKLLLAEGKFGFDGSGHDNTASETNDDGGICLDLRGIHYSSPHAATQNFEVNSIVLRRADSMGNILAFPNDSTVGLKQSDFICQITTASKTKNQQQKIKQPRVCRIMVPNSAKLSVTTTDIFTLQDVAARFTSVFELISSITSLSASPEPQPTSNELAIIGQTSSFNVKFTIGDDNDGSDETINAAVFPISLDSNHIAFCPQVVVTFPGANTSAGIGGEDNSIVLKKLSFKYSGASNSRNPAIKTLHVMTGNVQLDVAYLQQLGDQFKARRAAWEAQSHSTHALSTNKNINSANIFRDRELEKNHMSFHDDESNSCSLLELKVIYLGMQLGLPGKLSRFDIDLGDLHARLLASGASVLELHTIHISRDMGDIDSALGHLSIVHKVNERKTVRFPL
jgi:hypothetical protein